MHAHRNSIVCSEAHVEEEKKNPGNGRRETYLQTHKHERKEKESQREMRKTQRERESGRE